MKITNEQKKAIYRKYLQNKDNARTYLEFRRRVIPGYDCLMIQWCGMWLGIEKDGYTHS